MKNIRTPSAESGTNVLLRFIHRLNRQRYRAATGASAEAPGRKLQPIAEILAQSGREPQSSD